MNDELVDDLCLDIATAHTRRAIADAIGRMANAYTRGDLRLDQYEELHARAVRAGCALAPPIDNAAAADAAQQKDRVMLKDGNKKRSETSGLFETTSKGQATKRAPACVDEPVARWVLVTPAQAAEWLEKNSRNRRIRDDVVAAYARDMKAGNWRRNGETIKRAADGTLLDGQHRLNAVVVSGATVWLLVVSGVESDTQFTMDRGPKRTDADELVMRGVKYANERASWVNTIHSIATGTHKRMSFAERATIQRRFRRAVEWAAENILHGSPLKKAPIMGALVFAYPVAPEKVHAFTNALRTGANLPEGSPALQLRNYGDRLAYVRQSPLEISGKTLRAVHAHLHDETILRNLYATDSAIAFFRKANGY